MTRHTVLIGLDGATFTVLDPLMRDGTMPFLREYAAMGVRAPLRTVIPALTPPAWTSMVTGCNPGRHGIFNFFGKQSAESDHIRFLTSHDVSCETIWAMASRNGLRATVLNFPLTFPAPAVNGHVVAGGWMPWRQLRLGCYPADLYDRLKMLEGFNPRELAMDMAHEEKALEGCRQEEYADWIALHIRRERHWLNVLRSLLHQEPSDLIAVLFDGVDKLQHLCWRFLDPAYADTVVEPWEQQVRAQCLDYFRLLDDVLAEIVALAGPDATVVLASDHGFGPQVRTFFPNTWLEQLGLLAWADGAGPRPAAGGVLGMGHVARHVYLLDWTRTVAYSSMPGGNGIHIVRADAQHPHGVSEQHYEPLRMRLIDELLRLRDPVNGEPVVAAVWRREDIFAGPHMELAPDLTVELTDGGLMSILAAESPVIPRAQPMGAHRPDGIFIAHGPTLRRGATLPSLSILDVAPLLLYSLALPIMSDLEGRLPLEAFEPDALHVQPPRRELGQPALHSVLPATPMPDLDEEEEAEILRRLHALGYVE